MSPTGTRIQAPAGPDLFQGGWIRRAATARSLPFWCVTAVLVYYWTASSGIVLDDAYIYYRIAGNFARTGRPVFNTGDPAFIATSPLWTLLLAAGAWLRPSLNLVLWAKTLCGILLIAAAYCAHRLFSRGPRPQTAFIAAPFLLYHAVVLMTGNEIALLYALLFGALWAGASDRPMTAGALAGMAALARGEGILILIPLLVFDCANARRRGDPLKQIPARAARMLGAAALPILLTHLFLWHVFGNAIPGTLAVKRMQGLSGKWPPYSSEIWASLKRALPGLRLGLLPLAAWGALRYPWFSAGMGSYILMHAMAYAWMKIPAYGWYYYDILIFVPILMLLGLAQALDALAGEISRWADRRPDRWTVLAPPRAAWTGCLFLGVILWMFPIHPALFHPGNLRPPRAEEVPDERIRSYSVAARRLLPELKPGDVVLTSEIGILGYVMRDVEIRDNNGLASPVITRETMNCWECAIDRYRPRFIIFPVKVEDDPKVFRYAGKTYAYRLRFIADPTAARYAASVYEVEPGAPVP